MASSRTSSSSCSSAHSSPFSSPKFSRLPVMPLRSLIVEKVLENRVTLIVGETGCGKSSLVPQFFLEENMEPVLCTQPRRFAVMAVANMVAKARKCELGEEVGYHIGHSKALSKRSKLVFKTAGVLLDEMREKGLNALRYKVIILDEVHERSVESDLVLLCVKQFLLKNNDLRVVLMSATADIRKYREYFEDVCRGERIGRIAIPNSPQHTSFIKNVFHLEQVTKLLGKESTDLSMYFSGRGPSISSAEMKSEVHKLIHELVLHIHNNDPDIEKSILVFLPTYQSLEQQWRLLEPLFSLFKVHVLHSSIATAQALMSIEISKSHRKVILATNIAESSVTIPKVAYVIDSCRSLQVFWDSDKKIESAKLVWVSKSQAEQRRGRTGRTCDGQIFRMVTGSFFNTLHEHESPAMLKLSLRHQVLLLCCAESKVISDPRVLLQKALDPPRSEIVEDALHLLVHIQALKRGSGRGRYEPTFYGRLIASFSLSFDASILIIKFGSGGMLYEGVILGALIDMQPLPILRTFGQDLHSASFAESYFVGDGKTVTDKGELLLMANLCAFQFYQRAFRDKTRLENLKRLAIRGEAARDQTVSEDEEQWCSFHNLLLSSLHNVTDTYHDVLASLHRFRPSFLWNCGGGGGVPTCYEPRELKHACLLQTISTEDDSSSVNHGTNDGEDETVKCVSTPFVGAGCFMGEHVAERLTSIVQEIRREMIESAEQENDEASAYDLTGIVTCKYFSRGACSRGRACRFLHSFAAPPPPRLPCKFFLSLRGCRNGSFCRFSHAATSNAVRGVLESERSGCVPEEEGEGMACMMNVLGCSTDRCIVVLDDTDLHLSSNIARYCYPSEVIATTHLSEMSVSGVEFRVLWGLRHPRETILSVTEVPWEDVTCAVWFPSFAGFEENEEQQRNLVIRFFQYLAIRVFSDALPDLRAVVTMNNLRFSQLQVERLARNGFFFLAESFPFDQESFGVVSDVMTTKKPMFQSKPVSYVFDLHRPTDLDISVFHDCLQRER